MLSDKNYNQFILSLDNDLELLIKIKDILTRLDNSFLNECYFINRTNLKELINFISSYCTNLTLISDNDIVFNHLDVLEITNYILANQDHYIKLELPKIEGV